ncbi:MAG: hypothetical protein Ta2B_00880 [Termitinemataceae bacterium]|nr:MAG: hypothetical protein Ta2B_00880 [Termitinemataceae bacterium]
MNYENFFNKVVGGVYSSGIINGGNLHHWVWKNTDKVDEIGNFLIKKGYTFQERYPSAGTISGALQQQMTRVEMNNLTENNFAVEYFDGTGAMYCKHYYNSQKILRKLDFLTALSIFGSIASVAGLILNIIQLCGKI